MGQALRQRHHFKEKLIKARRISHHFLISLISDSLNFHSSLSGYSSIALRIEDRIQLIGVWLSVVGGISIAATARVLSSLSGEYR